MVQTSEVFFGLLLIYQVPAASLLPTQNAFIRTRLPIHFSHPHLSPLHSFGSLSGGWGQQSMLRLSYSRLLWAGRFDFTYCNQKLPTRSPLDRAPPLVSHVPLCSAAAGLHELTLRALPSNAQVLVHVCVLSGAASGTAWVSNLPAGSVRALRQTVLLYHWAAASREISATGLGGAVWIGCGHALFGIWAQGVQRAWAHCKVRAYALQRVYCIGHNLSVSHAPWTALCAAG